MRFHPEYAIYPLVGIGDGDRRQMREMRPQFIDGAVEEHDFADIGIEFRTTPQKAVQMKVADRAARESPKLQVQRAVVVLRADYAVRDRRERRDRGLFAHGETALA